MAWHDLQILIFSPKKLPIIYLIMLNLSYKYYLNTFLKINTDPQVTENLLVFLKHT